MAGTELEIIWQTPIGRLTSRITGQGVRTLAFAPAAASYPVSDGPVRIVERRGDGAGGAIETQVRLTERFFGDYFAGRAPAERPGLDWGGASEFNRKVWRACARIGFGQTVTYGELAAAVSRPEAARAVGGAMRCNPLPLLVPCHRVLASGRNRLGGFSGGLALKAWLLAHEGVHLEIFR